MKQNSKQNKPQYQEYVEKPSRFQLEFTLQHSYALKIIVFFVFVYYFFTTIKPQYEHNDERIQQFFYNISDRQGWEDTMSMTETKKEQRIYEIPIKPQLVIPSSEKRVTAVFTSSRRYDLLDRTLSSFFQMNTFPVEKVIVVEDGKHNRGLQKMMRKLKKHNITWIVTGKKVGQIVAIDIGYAEVKTPFVFHSEDDWLYVNKGFIETSFDYFERIPNIIQTWVRVDRLLVDPVTRLIQSRDTGFSLNPSLKKMSDYYKIKGGYTELTLNISYGKGSGAAQRFITKNYIRNKVDTAQAQVHYVEHLGRNRGLNRS